MTRRMHINTFLVGNGHHEGAWRTPDAQPDGVLTAEYFADLAGIAERGKLDSVFFGDSLAVGQDIRHFSRDGLEPITLLAALAMVTTHIGLVATASTSYNTPFDLARKFASLDHISHGRVAWNVVTSALEDEARNFMAQRPDHEARYERATEFVDVAFKLWDSWEDGARLVDKVAGVYVDTSKVHRLDHHGKYFSVRGPLNVPRSPQGRPVIVQAGSSNDGMRTAARFADAVFTAQTTLESGQAFYADQKGRLAQFGRQPEDLLILPGIVPTVGSTEEEAIRKRDDLNTYFSESFGVTYLSRYLEHDMTQYPMDETLPRLPGEEADAAVQGGKTRFAVIMGIARRENLTIRQLVKRLAGGSGHLRVTGTPGQIADAMEQWFTQRGCDGFNMIPQALPNSLSDFVDHVVPELQRRGLFRTEYTGRTLRDNLGLARPQSFFKTTG